MWMFLQQILTNRLLQAVIDSKKIISMMGSIVNVTILKKKKKKKRVIHKTIHNIVHNSWIDKLLVVLI